MILNTQGYHKKKHQDKLSKMRTEELVHEALECCWHIGEAKWHHYKLVMTFMSVKSCFRNVFLPYSYLMVTRPQIQFGVKFFFHGAHIIIHQS